MFIFLLVKDSNCDLLISNEDGVGVDIAELSWWEAAGLRSSCWDENVSSSPIVSAEALRSLTSDLGLRVRPHRIRHVRLLTDMKMFNLT